MRLCRLGGYIGGAARTGVRTAYEHTLERLRAGGAVITTTELRHADDIASIYLVVSLAEGAAYHAKTLEQCPELYDPSVRLRVEQGRYILAEDYLRALAGCEVIREEVSAALADVDALILPGIGDRGAEARSGHDHDRRRGPAGPRADAASLAAVQSFRAPGARDAVRPDKRAPAVSLQLVGQRSNTRALLDVGATIEAAIR